MTNKNWEKEFEEWWDKNSSNHGALRKDKEHIKQFMLKALFVQKQDILNQEAERRKREKIETAEANQKFMKERFKKIIEGMKKEDRTTPDSGLDEENLSYNQALSDILKALEE